MQQVQSARLVLPPFQINSNSSQEKEKARDETTFKKVFCRVLLLGKVVSVNLKRIED